MGKSWSSEAVMKITQKSLSELPEGVHQIEPNFFIRVRGGYANFIFVYRKEGRRKEIASGARHWLRPKKRL